MSHKRKRDEVSVGTKKFLPRNVRGTTPGNSKWSYCKQQTIGDHQLQSWSKVTPTADFFLQEVCDMIILTVAISSRFLLARDVYMISTTIAISSLQHMIRQNSKLLQEQTNKQKKENIFSWAFSSASGSDDDDDAHTYIPLEDCDDDRVDHAWPATEYQTGSGTHLLFELLSSQAHSKATSMAKSLQKKNGDGRKWSNYKNSVIWFPPSPILLQKKKFCLNFLFPSTSHISFKQKVWHLAADSYLPVCWSSPPLWCREPVRYALLQSLLTKDPTLEISYQVFGFLVYGQKHNNSLNIADLLLSDALCLSLFQGKITVDCLLLLICFSSIFHVWHNFSLGKKKFLPNTYFHLLIWHNCLGKNKLYQNFLSSLWERSSCAKDERSLRKQIKQRTKGEHTRTILGFNKQARQKEELDKTFFLREELLCCNAIAKATS